MIANNGRNNLPGAQQHQNNNHTMNRQQASRPQAGHHQYAHQQQQPHHHQQHRTPGSSQIQRHGPNPNLGQQNRNVSANVNRSQQQHQQRPHGQQLNHTNHRPQQQRPMNPNMQSRQMNPNGPSRPMNPNAPARQGHQSAGQQRTNSQGPNSQQRPQGANNGPSAGPPLPNVLPKGWKKEEIVRKRGITAGLVDVVYVPSPSTTDLETGKKFRSKLELQRYFGNRYDMSLLDYRSGKLSQVNWRKQRRMKSLAVNNTNYASAAKYDNYLNLPIRQTASIFKQSVSYITNNHRNEPTPASALTTTANKSNEKPKPTQLFWELRFNKLKANDTRLLNQENISQEFELENIPKFKNFELSNESVLRSVAASWYLNQSKSLTGQEKEFSKNARIFIDREQPLIPQSSIKEIEIKSQEKKLKEIRKQLQSTLMDLENMDFMSIEEIELAEQERIEQEKLNAEVKDNKSEELIIL